MDLPGNAPFTSERILVDGVLVKCQLFGSVQGRVGEEKVWQS